jgi:hypothetical protein
MADKQSKTCAHPSCNCPPAKDSKYCGTLCEASAGRADIICGCGHVGCEAAAYAGSELSD